MTSLRNTVTQLEYQYLTHKSRRSEKSNAKKRPASSEADVVFTALHSLTLHVQAAFDRSRYRQDCVCLLLSLLKVVFVCFRLQNIESSFEGTDVTVTPCLRDKWLQQLSVVKHELEACDDCYHESLKRIRNTNTATSSTERK